jgi:hypothetical protein
MKSDGKICLYKAAAQKLNNPLAVNFWWSDSERAFFVGAAKDENSELNLTFRRQYTVHQGSHNVNNKPLTACLYALAGFENGYRYQIIGKYIPKCRMLMFKVDKAVKVEISSKQNSQTGKEVQ